MELPLVFVIGDSISIQYGPFLQTMLKGVYRYARKSGEEEALKNLDNPMGANGGDSHRVRQYFSLMAADPSWQPDLVLINCGLHDINFREGAHQVPLPVYRDNLTAIAQTAAEHHVTVAWVLTTPVNSEIHHRVKGWDRFERDIAAYNAVATEIMLAAGIPVIDLFTMTDNLGMNEAITADGVHFRPEVSAQQAAFLTGWLFARIGH